MRVKNKFILAVCLFILGLSVGCTSECLQCDIKVYEQYSEFGYACSARGMKAVRARCEAFEAHMGKSWEGENLIECECRLVKP